MHILLHLYYSYISISFILSYGYFPCVVFSIFALSMERTRLSFHCWLYSLCIVVYVTNKTWNLKLELELQDARNYATERPLKTQLWRSSMSQSLPTILLHTQKYVLFLHKKRHSISMRIGTQHSMQFLHWPQDGDIPYRITAKPTWFTDYNNLFKKTFKTFRLI